MDELHAAIAAHLRRHNRRLGRAPIDRVWREALRTYGVRAVHCQVCGKAITSGEGLFALERLREARRCADHYIPY
jgi:hypothetical protein